MRASRDRAQRNLYVLNLPLDATTDQFEALFAQYGPVEHAVILATLDNLARRRGFILMANAAQARAAIDNLNGHVWHNYRIEVSFAIVQRSGTPFSQEAAEPLGGEGTPQSRPTDTCNRVSYASLLIVIVRRRYISLLQSDDSLPSLKRNYHQPSALSQGSLPTFLKISTSRVSEFNKSRGGRTLPLYSRVLIQPSFLLR